MSPVTVIVVAFDMQRELPRTLHTLSGRYQREAPETEVIVVDNGSTIPVDPRTLDALDDGHLISIAAECAPGSPAPSANRGLWESTHEIVGLMIDGARMLSPGLLSLAEKAIRTSDRAIVATFAYHLGHTTQMKASQNGYDQDEEDRLLQTVDWQTDGYELFRISTLAGSSSRGWFGPMGESNAIFMRRSMWEELGGLDESFARPGGGLVNHDLYRRACELDDVQLFALLGEGSFHQFHGGAATSRTDTHDELWAEYRSIRGRDFAPPELVPTLIGRVPPQAVPHLVRSTEWRTRQ